MYRPSRTWWGVKFLDVLKISMNPGRLSRGRSYMTPSRMLEYKIEGSKVSAKVQGNAYPHYGMYEASIYDVSFNLKPFTKVQWNKMLDKICDNAAYISQILIGEMPSDIESLFEKENLNLLPLRSQELVSRCSCPDYASPCKHVAGLCYKIASMLDHDPLLLFQLRGLDFDRLQEKISENPLGKALIDQNRDAMSEITLSTNRYTQPALEPSNNDSIATYWQGTFALLDQKQSKDYDLPPAILIRRGGDFPAFWTKKSSFVTVMEELYQRILNDIKRR